MRTGSEWEPSRPRSAAPAQAVCRERRRACKCSGIVELDIDERHAYGVRDIVETYCHYAFSFAPSLSGEVSAGRAVVRSPSRRRRIQYGEQGTVSPVAGTGSPSTDDGQACPLPGKLSSYSCFFLFRLCGVRRDGLSRAHDENVVRAEALSASVMSSSQRRKSARSSVPSSSGSFTYCSQLTPHRARRPMLPSLPL